MITLAFDSTARAASVAVVDGERALGIYSIDNGLTQSELLLPMAENMLKSLHLSFDDVGLLACTVGPGSFTGVRIGVALVKGLAFGRNLPCVSVSTLEALAQNIAPLDGILVPVMDARRGQFYTALFESDGDGIKRLTDDMAISGAELAQLLKKYTDRKIYLSGDGYTPAKRVLAEEGIITQNTPELLITQNAYSCAIVAVRKHALGEYGNDLQMAPTYLRLPQAERERLEREKTNKENI